MTWEIVAKKISQLDYMLKLPAFQKLVNDLVI